MSAWGTASSCDLVLFILDAHRQIQVPDPRVIRLISNLGSSAGTTDLPPAILVLNKCEMVPPEQRPDLLSLAGSLRDLHDFQDTFWVSALKGRGVPGLKEYLLSQATPGRWTLEAGMSTDRSAEDLALEIVREKIFQRFYDELPYELTVVPVSCKSLRDGSMRVEHIIVVPHEGVKKIVVGSHGAALKHVGTSARMELQRMWGHKVHLILTVKVAK
ncbi:hypothetical protein ACKKBG_A35230 [Auxenochlorella protothecoides x Auxenochlorella symbiontica]